MPVISLEEGRQIGLVKGLVLDYTNKKVAALIIEQKGWFKEQRFIPYHKIHSVGTDVITVEKTSGAERAAGLPEIIKLLREKVKLTGSRIVAENGTVLGYVDEYYVDPDSGSITGLEFSGKFLNGVIKGRALLDIGFVRAIGKEVVVVVNEAVNNVIKLDGGLQETVKSIRESTGHLWENTLQKTREISSNINKSLEKVKRDKRFGFGSEDRTEAFEEKNTEIETESPATAGGPAADRAADEKNPFREESAGENAASREYYKH